MNEKIKSKYLFNIARPLHFLGCGITMVHDTLPPPPQKMTHKKQPNNNKNHSLYFIYVTSVSDWSDIHAHLQVQHGFA
jgi:hypothetical protein